LKNGTIEYFSDEALLIAHLADRHCFRRIGCDTETSVEELSRSLAAAVSGETP
jgi:hypothetical protein